MSKKPSTAILFLYEGDTESGFYDTLFEKLGLNRNVQIKKKCLQGNWNLNKKVAHQIDLYLDNDSYSHVNDLKVFVAYDREGDRTNESKINNALIAKSVKNKRLKEIHEIIATQMLESWFFIDIDGIYAFLRTPTNKRNPKKYARHENFTHHDLHTLFQLHDGQKRYMKGHRTANFIENLDVVKIYEKCPDLKQGIDKIKALAKAK